MTSLFLEMCIRDSVYTDKPLKSFINGLTGITQDKIQNAPQLEQVLSEFKAFVGDRPLIGYNAKKSDLPILLENGLDLEDQYAVDVFDEAFERRPSDPVSYTHLDVYKRQLLRQFSLLLRHLLKIGELLLPLILSFPMSLHKSVD